MQPKEALKKYFGYDEFRSLQREIIDPLAMFTPGFQLSFACVLGLMALQRRIAEQIRRLRDKDIEIAASKITVQGARYPEHAERMTGR